MRRLLVVAVLLFICAAYAEIAAAGPPNLTYFGVGTAQTVRVSGNHAVWKQYFYGRFDLWTRVLPDGGGTSRLAYAGRLDVSGDTIATQEDGDIYAYDFLGGAASRICTSAGSQTAPSI